MARERAEALAAAEQARRQAEAARHAAERSARAASELSAKIRWLAADPKLTLPGSEIMRLLAPRRAIGVDKVRLGSDRDGGYVLLDDLDGIAGAVSCGIADDVSFDLDLAARGIPVLQIDDSIDAPPASHPLFRFARRRLVGATASPGEVTLGALIAECAGGDGAIICKLDVEGSEWEALLDPCPEIARCRQLIVEFHHLGRLADANWWARAKQCLETIATTHQSVHIHGNNHGHYLILGGVPIPDVCEVTFALRSGYRFEAESVVFPTPLDRPNTEGRAEMFLGTFAASLPDDAG
jgi:hypothetical protein